MLILNRLSSCAMIAVLASAVASAQLPFHRTFFGGSGSDRIQGVAVDRFGHIYVTGHTNSADFAASMPAAAGGYDTSVHGQLDAFVAALSHDLQHVLHWTILGGTEEDRGYAVEVLSTGDVVVVGLTESPNFPTTNGVAHHGSSDAFVARFSPDLTLLRSSAVFGGSGYENPRGSFCVNAAGCVFIGGHTSSLDLPTTAQSFQPQHAPVTNGADWDGFVAKINPAGNCAWVTYLGGAQNDAAYSGVRLGADGSVYVAGMTNSTDFPTTAGAFQTQYQGPIGSTYLFTGDGFVARLRADGSGLIFSTLLGGSSQDYVSGNDALELDAHDNVVVTGGTWSMDFPVTSGAFDTHCEASLVNEADMFVAKLSSDGAALQRATFIGGERFEESSGLVLDDGGAIYVSGNTGSANYPVTLDAEQSTYSGGVDAVITKLSPDLDHLVYSTYVGGHGQSGMGDRGRGLSLTPSGDLVLGGDTDSTDLPLSNYTYDDQYGGGADDGFVSTERLSSSYPFGAGKVNSLGQTPVLSIVGAPSVLAGSFDLHVSNAVPLRAGVFIEGDTLAALPYFGATLYVSQPMRRTARAICDANGVANATVPVTLGMVGITRVYQYWYRDPPHSDGTKSGITNAYKVTFVVP